MVQRPDPPTTSQQLERGRSVDVRPPGPTVPELILAQARRRPDAVALEAVDGRLSYAELVARAGSIALHLRRLGVSPGDVVAVALPRTGALVPALLGVQLCGAAYLPLDADHPSERLDYIVHDCGAKVLLAEESGGPDLPGRPRVSVSDITVTRQPYDITPPDPNSAAYVIYTSGSTGRPKGVLVSHRALANVLTSIHELLALPDDVVLPAVTTVSFDIAGLELFMPLTTGGRVVVGQRSDAGDPQRLSALLARTGASVLQATPTSWRLLLEAGWVPPAGFTVLCGGERLPAELAERLTRDGVVLWDLYGPTETTIWSSLTRYRRGVPTRFHPVQETSLHLLDDRLGAIPAGEKGELYIGGPGLAAGYLGRPGLTAQRFVADPTSSAGARLYRTGDVARRLPDGRIEILARTDDQMKIRGFRVEPGEIEDALSRHPAVVAAAVAAQEGADGPRLLAYVQPVVADVDLDERQLRRHLSRSLPDYMIPAQFLVVDELPMTPNGKLDRAALSAVRCRPHATPATPAGSAAPEPVDGAGGNQQLVARILATVLAREHVGLHDDFFSLGGDSLRAVHAILRLNAELQTQLPVNALFETRTVYGLARLLDGDGTLEPLLCALPPGLPPRLSAGQWRLWLHQQLAPGSVLHNRAVALRIPEPVDADVARTAVAELVARHGTLRTCYRTDDSGAPVPVTAEPAAIPLTVEDGDPQEVLATELARPFDLAASAPVRTRLVRTGAGEHCLLLVVHEIAADARSRALLARQLRAALRGRPVTPPALAYVDYAAWQREMAAGATAQRHLEFWRTALSGLNPAALHTDRPRPRQRDRRAGTVSFTIAPDVVTRIRDLAAEHGAPPAVGLLTGLFAVLDRHTTGSDLSLGVHVDGADQPELQHVAGAFETVTPFRVLTAGTNSFEQLLERVREAAIAALGHAVPPLEDIVSATVDTVAPPEPGRNPLFDVSFALRAPTGLSDLPLPPTPEVTVDLHCDLTELPEGGIAGRLEYATTLFDLATVQDLADEYLDLLLESTTAVAPVARAAAGG